METKINSVKTDDIEMEYFTFGNGPKNLVILPGLSLKSVTRAADGISKAYNKFTKYYKVYVFDRRINISDDYTVAQMAEDTVKVMKFLGINKADFFGTSQGGIMTQLIAINHPEIPEKIIIGSSISRVNETAEKVVTEWVTYAMNKDLDSLANSCLHLIYSKLTVRLFGDKIERSCKSITDEERKRFIILASACKDFNTYNQLEKIKCPVFVIGAKGDKVVTPEASIEIAKKLNCKIHMYGRRFGHAVYDEAADYKKRMLKFLLKN